MFAASTVAKYFLSRSDEEAGDTMSNLKLQKLLYYAQGFHLAMFDEPLFIEPIEAWRHGPVVRQVYAEYAWYGSGSIPAPAGFDPAGVMDQETHDLLGEVHKVYGQYSAWRLREMTHAESPWQNAWKPDTGPTVIPHEAMRDYFKTLLTED